MEKITTLEFILSLGIVTLLTSVLTLIITQIIKLILTKTKVINDKTNELKKDVLLSRIGSIVGILTYITLYIVNEIINNQVIEFNEGLVINLVSGISLSLTITKGLYTSLHQFFKKENIFEQLEYVEQVINKLNEEVETKWIVKKEK